MRPDLPPGWLTIEQARTTPGLRITDSPRWAALWAQILRAILHVKKIPYHKVLHPPFRHEDPQAQAELRDWTAQTSVPTMVYGDGTPAGDTVRNDWLNQLMLAEQIEPSPSLVPSDGHDRVTMFGLAHEIMSPQGFMWNGRLVAASLVDQSKLSEKQRNFFGPEKFLGGKYSYNAKGKEPIDNMRDCLALLDEQLRKNAATGSRFFVGDQLTALDLYWVYASIFARVLSPEEMPVMSVNRALYPPINALLEADVSERLLAHRDYVFTHFCECPMAVE